jgi:hypothetical protein
MMINNVMAACKAYAQELHEQGAEVVTCTLDTNLDDEVPWAPTWGNGVPETKMFNRNDHAPVFVRAGETLTGVSFTGNSGRMIFDFIRGSYWFRVYPDDSCLPVLMPVTG